ncbi:hypothetical protein [Treponema primitia]|uniref:hypothetical protein n=1 Tax=Treponema primitia TaxID=88058 RepID=UPI00025557E9|nr:hypothetical protein [Treponema primitia]
MKRMAVFLFAVGITLSAAWPVYAQNKVPEYRIASGRWGWTNDRFFQNDTAARLAKVNLRVPQSGSMEYIFNIRYEGGAEDGHGGVGIHVFSDTAYDSASWGCGHSYLLWLNYDEKPISRDIPAGLSAQVYRSYTNSRMDLVQSISLKDYEKFLTAENLDTPVVFRIEAYGNTGDIRVYDPTDEGQYYLIKVNPRDVPLKGDWVALRTNGLKASFAPGL